MTTDHQPLTAEDLDQMEDRARDIDRAREAYDSAEDVPPLLAEVRRLQAELNKTRREFKDSRDSLMDEAEQLREEVSRLHTELGDTQLRANNNAVAWADASDERDSLSSKLAEMTAQRDSARTIAAQAIRDGEATRERDEARAERDALAARLDAGDASDGYHTHNELYEYRLLYNAHAARGWLDAGYPVSRSKRHHDGEECFGGGWFIVVATLPTGQVSNHYRLDDWDLFEGIPELPTAPMLDGHTPADAAERLRRALDGGEDQ